MNVACSSCNTQYKIDESKVPPSGGFIKCKTCGERVKIPPPGAAAPAEPPLVPVPDVPPVPPASEPSIPLAGTESIPIPDAPPADAPPPAIPPATGAIPLAGSQPGGDAIPRGGPSDLPVSASGVLSGADDDAPTQVTEPAPPADDAPTVVSATPSLPPSQLPAEDDETPAMASPIVPPALEPAGPPADDAPTQVTETPRFLDNLPSTLDDLPAALPIDETVAGAEPELVVEPEPPVSAESQSLETSLFDDLPTASRSIPTVEEPAILELADDLPVPEATPAVDDLPSLVDDLPTEAPALVDDLPTEAPALMDDLPTQDRTDDAVSAPSLMDEPVEGQVSAPAIHPAELGSPPPPDAAPAIAKAPAGPGRIIAIAGGGVVVALLGAVALTTPYLGVQVLDPFGLAAEPEPAPPEPQPPQAKAKAKAKAKTKAKAPPPAPEPPPEPETVELSADNVDTLAFAALRASTATFADEADAEDDDAQALLAWARFRLASHGDEDARAALTAALPKRPHEITKMGELAAAAAVGGLALTGKPAPARKVGERLQRSRFKESAHLALALSTAYTRRAELPKALRHVERARKLAPDLPDVALRRGLLLLAGREPDKGADALVKVATDAGDPDVTVLVANALLDARQFAGVSQVAAGLENAEQIKAVAPRRHDVAWRILCYHHLRSGDLKRAAEIAAARVKTNSSPELRIEYARLTAAAGGDGDAVLKTPPAEELDSVDTAHFLAERVRLALQTGTLDAAKTILAEKEKLGKKTGGWVRLAEGWIARKEGNNTAARAAFTAAAKKKLTEARLEVVLLSTDKPGPLTKKLTDLERRSALPAASYHLAKLMRARGNFAGAAELLERVLWTEPTIIHPLELVLEWAKTAALAGETERAMATVASARANQPNDLRPALALIELKRKAGAHDEVIAIHRELLAAKPNDGPLTVGLAAALNRNGDHSEAQALLDALFKHDESTRTPEALVELARAWADREPYRARQLVRESIESKPTAEKYMLLGQLAVKRKQIDEARKVYSKAIELDDTAVDAYVGLARIDLEDRAFDKVVAGLEKVLQLQPKHLEAATVLGDVYVETGKPREAIKHYEIALSVKETDDVLMKVARLQLQRLGQLAPATKTLRRVIAINPTLAEAHFHLGMALKDQGLIRDAATSLQKCLSLEPEGDWADEAKRILQDLGYP